MTIRQLYRAAPLLLAITAGASCTADEQHVEESADAGSDAPDTIVLSNDLSECAKKRQNQLANSPYVALSRWYSASRGDTLVSASLQWVGCNSSDVRSSGDKTPAQYAWVEELGLIFRPDWQQPPGTIPLYSRTGWPIRAGSNPQVTFFDQRVTMDNGAYADYSAATLEGYVYPPDWRPATGTRLLTQVESVNPAGDWFAKVPASLSRAGGETARGSLGYVLDPSVLTAVVSGACSTHNDCAATQVCFVTDGDAALSDGTRGSCVRRCRTDLDCTDGSAPRCDVVAQHCVAPMLEFDGPDAKLTRASTASYHISADRLEWAAANELRWEDRGDGYGELPLLEPAATNYVRQSNSPTTTYWTHATMQGYTSSDSPGPHDAILMQATSTSPGWLRVPSFTPTVNLGSFTFSMWTRNERGVMPASYYDIVRVNQNTSSGTTALIHTNFPTRSPEWMRVDTSRFIAAPSTLTPTSLDIGMGINYMSSPTAIGDRRLVAYVQLEEGRYSTSAIYTDGNIATRAADILDVTARNTRMSTPFRVFFIPAFHYYEGATHTLLSFRNAAGTETHALQLSGNVLRLIDAAGTILGSVSAMFWERQELLYVDVNPGTRVFTISGGGGTSSFTATNTSWTLPGTVRVGSRADGSTPFAGRISEPVPLNKLADIIPPRALEATLSDTGWIGTATLRLRVNEERNASSTWEVREGNRVETGSLFRSTFTNSSISAFDPGRLHTVTLRVRDVAGNELVHPIQYFAAGQLYPGPAGALARLRSDVRDNNMLTAWRDLSGNRNNVTAESSAVSVITNINFFRGQAGLLFSAAAPRPIRFASLSMNGAAAPQLSAYTLFMVVSRADAAVAPLYTTSNAKLFIDTDGRVKFTQGGTTLASSYVTTTSQANVIVLRVAANGTRELWVNGSRTADTVANTVTDLVGSLGRDGTTYATGHLAELVIYPSVLAESDRLTVSNYMRDRYGAP